MNDRADPASGVPPLRSDPNASTGPLFEFNRPTVIVLLYLATYFTGISAVLGVILAYVWREEAQEWEASHMVWLIRTFWLALSLLVAMIAGVIAVLAATSGLRAPSDGIAVAIILLLAILIPVAGVWLLVRCVVSLVRAQKHRAMDRPGSWWV